MSDLGPAIEIALQATKSIQDWCQNIMDAVERQLKLSEEFSTRRLYPLGDFLPLSLSPWVGIAVAAKDSVWRNNEPPDKGGYFLISFQQRTGTPWRVQTRWGLLDSVARTRGQFSVLDIYREVLDSVNRNSAGPIQAPHANGVATMNVRDLVDVMDRTAIQRLAEDVASALARTAS